MVRLRALPLVVVVQVPLPGGPGLPAPAGETFETSACAAVCGDGILAGNETCDDGINNGTGNPGAEGKVRFKISCALSP